MSTIDNLAMDVSHGPADDLRNIKVRDVTFDAPWDWLSAGWRDMWAVPHISLTYGAVFAVGALAMVLGLAQFGWQSLILALGGGFLLVAPLLGLGLYETSRRLETHEDIELSDVAGAGFRAKGQLSFMGIVLMLIFFAWIEIALILFMLFLGGSGLPPASEFIPTLLFTSQGLGLLIVGTLAGGILAAAVFAVSAVSVPLLMVRKINTVSAIGVSVEAVKRNPKAMALWAALIAGMMALGVITLFVGLVLAFPLIGHATWHAFRELIDIGEEGVATTATENI